jgi:molybdopterin-binding protein
MPISARNKLRGTIEEIVVGNVMAHVVMRVGDNLIESAITRRSAEEIETQEGRHRNRNHQSNRGDDSEGLTNPLPTFRVAGIRMGTELTGSRCDSLRENESQRSDTRPQL